MEERLVFQTNDEPLADMAIGLLKAEGIEAFKKGAGLRSSLAITMDGLGQIELYVTENEAERALEIIEVRMSADEDEAEEPEEPGECAE